MRSIRRTLRLIPALLIGAMFATGVAACGGSSDDSDPTYAPAAYWQSVSNVRECFYMDDTQEAYNLIAAGLCPAGSIPTPAPLTWRETYWSYYSSPAYYNTYIPVGYRTHYTSVTVVSFSRTYKTQISSLSSKAVYKSSSGGTVSGSKVNTKSFGSGSRSTQSFGGGSRSGSGSSGYSSSRSSYSGSRSAGRR